MFKSAKAQPRPVQRFTKVHLEQNLQPISNRPLPPTIQEKQNKRPLTLVVPQSDKEKVRKYQKT